MRMSSSHNVHAATLLIFVGLLLAVSASADDNNAVASADKKPKPVTYDGRSLIIDGKREILISGSIHYPRSVPEVG